jgi:RNA polymerase sigma-70 factor (ECF subfamily)
MAEKAKKKFFSKFYDKHIDKIYRFIFLKVNSKEVSEDLTSEVFLRFWQQLNSPIEIRNPRAFIYQIARNLIIDYYRQKKPQKLDIDEIELVDSSENPYKEAVLDSESRDLVIALSKMPEDYQDVIIWYYLNDLSVAEIADIVAKSEGAVRVMIHRALNALRREMGL